jgi:hypothetical protein
MSLILFLSMLFNLVSTPLSSAKAVQEPVNVEVSYLFGDAITIAADLPDMTGIAGGDVLLQTEESALIRIPVEVSDSGHLSANYLLDSAPFHVFDRVYYWFEITSSDGTVSSTPSYWFDYLDNRYEWQTSETKWFIIHTTPANKVNSADLQGIALSSLKYATTLLPVSPELPMQIYVYPDAASLTVALGSSSQPWAAGEADPELGVILVSESVDIDNIQELKRQTAHEIMHMLEYSAADGNYLSSPTWLLEGLAVNAEEITSADDVRMLQNAYRDNSLLSFDQLCTSMPPEASRSALAYAQSASFTSYLSQTYGNDKLLELLRSGGNGLNCSQLTTSYLGKDLASLESDWKNAVFSGLPKPHSIVDYWPLLLVLPLVVWGLLRIRKHDPTRSKKEPINGR